MTLGQFLGIVEMRTKVISMSTLAGATLYALRETTITTGGQLGK